MIRHHPDDAFLLAHAARTLSSGPAIVVAAHVEACSRCRQAVRQFESVGARLMEEQPGVALESDALEKVLARLDEPLSVPSALEVRPRPALPQGMNWPRSLRHCHVSRWRPLGPGLRWSRLRLPYDKSVNLVLLRIAAGKCLPPHSHRGIELTQVLYGSFDDGRAQFGPGDFDATDDSVRHQPVVDAGSECICLASVDGHLTFDSRLARWLGAIVGL